MSIQGTTLGLGKKETLHPGQGFDAFEAAATKPLEAVIPKRKIEDVLASYRKVMKVKADHIGLSLSVVKIYPF